MNRSPLRRTPEKSRTISRSRLAESNITQRASSSLYYCHYKNAMYMGGIKAFKKDGRGILLHDSGVSAITSYYNDLMHGHNIFFDNYNLLSGIFNKNRIIEAVYRTEGFLVYLLYNQQRELDGKAKVLNFLTKRIVYATFKKGSMIDKAEENDGQLLNRVFDLGQLELIVGRTHAKVINYEIEKIPNIECEKHGNKVIVGFEKNGFINGLGFQFIIRGGQGGYNPDTLRQEDEFELRMAERGYFINTQLNGMGQKVFRNGNFYIGEFKNGVFEGNGILKNVQKKNWVSGFFKNGNLIELLEYNGEGEGRKITRIMEALHERKTNWINYDIHLQDMTFFVGEIEKILTTEPNKQVETLEQRKLQVLKRIQQKFLSDDLAPGDEIESSIHQLKTNLGNSSHSKFIHSFGQPNNPRSSSRENIQVHNAPLSSKEYEDISYSRISKSNRSVSLINKTYLNPSRSRYHQEEPEWMKASDDVASKSIQETPPGKINRWNKPREEYKPPERSNIPPPLSSERSSLNSKGALDSKRMIAKNKIFKYLETQESQRSPQFNYTKVDTLRQIGRSRE